MSMTSNSILPDESKLAQKQRLETVREQALGLLAQLRGLVYAEPAERQPAWNEYIGMVQELMEYAATGTTSTVKRGLYPLTSKQLKEFGKLLRDKRNAAGLSRVNLARQAKVSDSTVKFIETARHPPSRATLIRLIGVPELNLSWTDVPGQPDPPATAPKPGEPTAGIGDHNEPEMIGSSPIGVAASCETDSSWRADTPTRRITIGIFADGRISFDLTAVPVFA